MGPSLKNPTALHPQGPTDEPTTVLQPLSRFHTGNIWLTGEIQKHHLVMQVGRPGDIHPASEPNRIPEP